MLNNKNEENEYLIEEITSKYEQEITKLREANQHQNVHRNEVIDEGALHRSRVSVLELELGNAKLELESQKKEYEELLSKEQRKQCTLRGQVDKLEKALEDAVEIRNQECKRFSEVQRTWEEHKCPSLSPLINTNQQLQRQLNEANDKLEEKCKETIEVQQNLSKLFKEQLGSLTDELRSKSEQVLIQERTIELLRRTVVESEAALAEAKTDYLEKEKTLREQLMQDYERKTEAERQRLLQQVDNKADQLRLTYEFKLRAVKDKLKESLEQFRKESFRVHNTQEFRNDIKQVGEYLSNIRRWTTVLRRQLLEEKERNKNINDQNNGEIQLLKSENLKLAEQMAKLRRETQILRKAQRSNGESTRVEMAKDTERRSTILETKLSEATAELEQVRRSYTALRNLVSQFIGTAVPNVTLIREQQVQLKDRMHESIASLSHTVRTYRMNTMQSILKMCKRFNQTNVDNLNESLRKAIRSEVEIDIRKETDQVIRKLEKRMELESSKYRKSIESLRQELVVEKSRTAQKICQVRMESERLEANMRSIVKAAEDARDQAVSEASKNRCKVEKLEVGLGERKQEMEKMRRKIEQLTQQLKLEKSTQFTELTASLDKKWAETLGRECARVQKETSTKLKENYHMMLAEHHHTHRLCMAQMEDMVMGKLHACCERVQLIEDTAIRLQKKFADLRQRKNVSTNKQDTVKPSCPSPTQVMLVQKESQYNCPNQRKQSSMQPKRCRDSCEKAVGGGTLNAEPALDRIIKHEKSVACIFLEQSLCALDNQLGLAISEAARLRDQLTCEREKGRSEAEENFKSLLSRQREEFELLIEKQRNEQADILKQQKMEYEKAQNILKAKIYELHQKLLEVE